MELEFSALTLLAIVVRRQSGYDTSIFDLLVRAEYLARTLGREAEAADFLFIRLMGAYTSIEKGRGQLARRMHELGQASSDPAVRRYGRSRLGVCTSGTSATSARRTGPSAKKMSSPTAPSPRTKRHRSGETAAFPGKDLAGGQS